MENNYTYNAIKYVSHEIKNQLSICDLYTEIIKKTCIKNEVFDTNIMKALDCIKKSLKMTRNSLLELKALDKIQPEEHYIGRLLKEAIDLSKIYGIQKNIQIENQSKILPNMFIDKSKFIATIINLIKNACEAFEDEPEKKIFIKAYEENKTVKILIENNGKPIEAPEKIFTEGFTTKESGNGLGLAICKTNLKKMNGDLKLLKSDTVSTIFEIELNQN